MSPASISPSWKRLASQLAAEVGTHPVCLVDDDEVPLGFFELRLQLLVAGELVHPRDQERVGLEDVEVDVGVDQLVREQVKRSPNLKKSAPARLLYQAARRDDEAVLDVIAEQQLLDVEAGHDRLARTGLFSAERNRSGVRGRSSP